MVIQNEAPQISEKDLSKIEKALSILTSREKEVYILVKGQGLSRTEAAQMLGVAKGTINNIIRRSEEKLKVKKSTAFFVAPLAN